MPAKGERMTDRYSLPSSPGDPPWATSREPAPPLWAKWCMECEARPVEAGPLSHRLATATDEDGALAQRLGIEWRMVGTGSPAPREARS